mmetsp:Transcript_42910/g.80046  ORF Transcript_42910/g.80046 Transcript_42910/m.80046 type:complete len:339 (+) Transcript_42910:93-1109(+)
MGDGTWGPPGQVSWQRMEDGCEVLLRKWEPEKGQAVGVLHICHGMAEHSARYAEVAQQFVADGFIVYAPDHRGHGHTALRAEEKGEKGHRLGHVDAVKGKSAVEQVVDDNICLCRRAVQEHGLPLVILGHSLGSVIATLVAAKVKVQDVPAALVLSAAPARLPAALDVGFGPLLWLLGVIYGLNGVAPLLDTMTFAKYNKAFAPTATDDDWLNRDAAEVQKYIKDPLCGFKVSVGFWKGIKAALNAVAKKETLLGLRKCPVLVIAGGQDFCAINDLGVDSSQQIVGEFRAAGLEVNKRIYYGDGRHEVLKETCREEVLQDLLTFVRRHVTSATPRSRL